MIISFCAWLGNKLQFTEFSTLYLGLNILVGETDCSKDITDGVLDDVIGRNDSRSENLEKAQDWLKDVSIVGIR